MKTNLQFGGVVLVHCNSFTQAIRLYTKEMFIEGKESQAQAQNEAAVGKAVLKALAAGSQVIVRRSKAGAGEEQGEV